MGNAGRVLMIPKGDYNAATTYERLDFVYYQGRSYVCKQTSTGNAPTDTTYWQALTGDASAEIQALTNYVTDTGVKNLLPNERGNATANGITATMNADGSVSFSNTATATTYYNFTDPAIKAVIPSGSYKLFVEGQTSDCKVFINKYKGNTYVGVLVAGSTDAVRPFTVAYDSTYDGIQVGVVINNGATVNTTIKAMITDASITDPTYQPYAKTNVELTQDVTQISDVVTISSDADLTKLKVGLNAVKFASGMVIGTNETTPITLAGNSRGQVMLDTDGRTFAGVITDYNLSNVYVIGSSLITSVQSAKKITTA